MPFVNEAQRRACYAQASRDLKSGLKKPRWNCKAYAGHQKKKNKKRSRKRSVKRSRKRSVKRSRKRRSTKRSSK